MIHSLVKNTEHCTVLLNKSDKVFLKFELLFRGANYENEANHKTVSSIITLHAALHHLFATSIIKNQFLSL